MTIKTILAGMSRHRAIYTAFALLYAARLCGLPDLPFYGGAVLLYLALGRRK